MGGGSSSSGGRAGGAVEYPGHMVKALSGSDKNTHPGEADWHLGWYHDIDHVMFDPTEGIHTIPGSRGSPLEETDPVLSLGYSYDPSDEFGEVQAKYADFDNMVAGISPDANLYLFADDAAMLVDRIDGGKDYVDDVVRLAHRRKRGEYLSRLGRFCSEVSIAGAVNSSTFVFELAKAENGFRTDMGRITVSAVNAATDRRIRLRLRATAELSNLFYGKLNAASTEVEVLGELARTRISLYKEMLDRAMAINIKKHVWPLELMQYGLNVIAAPSGSVVSPSPGRKDQCMGQSLLGAISGALVGAAAGQQYTGSTLGMIGGGLLGGVAGLLGAV